jgi:hypothetical protein
MAPVEDAYVPPIWGSAGVPRFFRLLLVLGAFNDRYSDLKCVFIIKMHTQSSLALFLIPVRAVQRYKLLMCHVNRAGESHVDARQQMYDTASFGAVSRAQSALLVEIYDRSSPGFIFYPWPSGVAG